MRRIVLLGLAWTVIVFVGLLVVPWSLPAVPCARLVGASAACLAQLAERNDRVWWSQTLPSIAVGIGGYAVLALFAVRHNRQSRG